MGSNYWKSQSNQIYYKGKMHQGNIIQPLEEQAYNVNNKLPKI